jgi:DNA-binding NarL/FixJ family response regulator
MSGVLLSPEDRAHLLRMMRRQTPSPVHRRMNTLLLLDEGWAVERVAEVLFIDAETVREHRRLYRASGITGVERLKYGEC